MKKIIDSLAKNIATNLIICSPYFIVQYVVSADARIICHNSSDVTFVLENMRVMNKLVEIPSYDLFFINTIPAIELFTTVKKTRHAAAALEIVEIHYVDK